MTDSLSSNNQYQIINSQNLNLSLLATFLSPLRGVPTFYFLERHSQTLNLPLQQCQEVQVLSRRYVLRMLLLSSVQSLKVELSFQVCLPLRLLVQRLSLILSRRGNLLPVFSPILSNNTFVLCMNQSVIFQSGISYNFSINQSIIFLITVFFDWFQLFESLSLGAGRDCLISDHFLMGVLSINGWLVSVSLKQNYLMLESSLSSAMLRMNSSSARCLPPRRSGRINSYFWIFPKLISTEEEFHALMSWLLVLLGYCWISFGSSMLLWTPKESNSKFLPSSGTSQWRGMVKMCQLVRSSSMTELNAFLFLKSCLVFTKGLLLIYSDQVCWSMDGSMLAACSIFS